MPTRRFLFPVATIAGLFGITSGVYANDAALVAVGGSAVPLNGEHSQVSMERETVHLDLYQNFYVTSVDFIFANKGKSTTVNMGFPERGVGEGMGKNDAIQKFVTTVDGRSVLAKRIKASADVDSYQAYWTKSVSFGKNQKRRVHVQFRSPYGIGIGGTLAAYDFTGGNWKGHVNQSRLVVTSHPGAPKLSFAELNGHAVSQGPSNATVGTRNFEWQNWEAEGRFILAQKKR